MEPKKRDHKVKNRFYWNFHQRDIEFVKDFGIMETKMLAQKYHISEGAVSNRMARVAERLSRCQNYVNVLRGLQSSNGRIKRFTTVGAIPEKYRTESYMASMEVEEKQKLEEKAIEEV